MTRKELYKEITSHNYQERVVNYYGKNFTICSNKELEYFLELQKKQEKPTCECYDVAKLVEFLAKKKILLNSEIRAIINKH